MDLAKTLLKKNTDEIFAKKYWRDVVCEFVATFFLVSLQTAAALTWTNPPQCTRAQYALGSGFAVVILTEAFAPMGGAHMNPAVTLGFAVAGEVNLLRGMCVETHTHTTNAHAPHILETHRHRYTHTHSTHACTHTHTHSLTHTHAHTRAHSI